MVKKDNVETLEKVNTILTFLSIGTFLINPMLRVHYIDKDYVALHEVDDIYDTVTKYQANTQPDPYKNLSDKYIKDVVQQQPMQGMAVPIPVAKPNPLPPPTIGELTPSVVEDIPKGEYGSLFALVYNMIIVPRVWILFETKREERRRIFKNRDYSKSKFRPIDEQVFIGIND